MLAGTLYALAAGLMWGFVFVAPLLLPEYPAALLSFGRYLAFGLVALPLAFIDLRRLRALTRADWLAALELAFIGNIVYYLLLAGAIQRAGGPLPTMIIGTLPVVIALASNRRDARRGSRRLPWARLAPSLCAIALGIGLVNHAELAALDPSADLARYALGALLAVGAVACWTWYPLRNADWLQAHADRSPTTWATAQGLATLPLALAGYLGFLLWSGATGTEGFALPFGPRPAAFIGVMAVMAFFASWLGTLCWNQASQRLPTTLVGQLIVFETLSALAYAFVLRGEPPGGTTLAGIALLIAGVSWALRAKPEPLAAQAVH